MTENHAILKVIQNEQEKYNQLKSEYNVLKTQHVKFLEESANDRINQAQKYIKLKQDYKEMKDHFVCEIRKLEDEVQYWQDLYHELEEDYNYE